MRVFVRGLFFIVGILGINLFACHSDGRPVARKTVSKGASEMKTYYMGRFRLDVPLELKQAVQAHTLRYARLEEALWPSTVTKDVARHDAWQLKMAEIHDLEKPHGVKDIIVKSIASSESSSWFKGVLYYGSYVTAREGSWGVMLDSGNVGLWAEISGEIEHEEDMKKDVFEILRAYKPLSPQNKMAPVAHKRNAYYLKYGVINLPYLEQEQTYARFEGPEPEYQKLEVEMNETHEVEKFTLAERLASAIATRFVPGVDAHTIRSRARKAAGLEGEELVVRMSASGEDTQIQFCWEYRGEPNSGEHPEIQITLETSDSEIDQKLKVWDHILDSFGPTFKANADLK